MPYQLREFESELFLITAIYGVIPGIENSVPKGNYRGYVFTSHNHDDIFHTARKVYDSLLPGDIEILRQSNIREKLHELVSLLQERQQQVISVVYGLNGTMLTSDEASQVTPRKDNQSQDTPLTEERIRQIRERSLYGLRRFERKLGFEEYVESTMGQLSIAQQSF